MTEEKRFTNYALISIAIFLIFRVYFIASTNYNLIADEAYFWDWSRHLDYSYYDQGPMIALIIKFFTSILPTSEFSVRLGAPVFSALTALVLFKLAGEVLDSKKLSFLLILLFIITPISTAGGVIITYYAPQVFYMSLTAFFLWRLIREDKGFWLYLTGLSLGLGLLSHHMFTFFSAEVGLFILLSKKHRKWFKRKELYIAIMIELIVASPVFIWNMNHEAVMAKHAVGLMTMSPDFLKIFLDFIGAQLAVHTPLFFLAVIYGLIISGYRGIIGGDDKYLFLFCLSAPLLAFIGLLCLGGRTEANWPMSAYITGSIAAVAIVSEKYKTASSIKKNIIKVAYFFSLLFGAGALVIISYPSSLETLFSYSLPPRMDPANRLYGWEELGNEVSAVLKDMPEETFVSTLGYGNSALLAFYVAGNPEIYEMPVDKRMSQYDFWNDAIPVKGKDAVFVNRRPIPPKIKNLFENVELAKHFILRTEDGEYIRKQFYIYRCYKFKGIVDESKSYEAF